MKAAREVPFALQAAGAVTAPPELHARIRELYEERQRQRWRPLAPAGALATAGALLLALVLVLPTGSGPPALDELATLASRPATSPGPAAAPGRPNLLEREVAGVPFPDFRAIGWTADGWRADTLDGRSATTVHYRRGTERIAYTIVSGQPLEPPDSAARLVQGGVRLTIVESTPAVAVMWERSGRTCLLSGPEAGREELLALAAWKGDGTVPF